MTNSTISDKDDESTHSEDEVEATGIWWKAIYILFFVIITLCSLVSLLSFGKFFSAFDYNCVLYSTVNFDNPYSNSREPKDISVETCPENRGHNLWTFKNFELNSNNIEFSNNAICYTVWFVPIFSLCSGIFGIVLTMVYKDRKPVEMMRTIVQVLSPCMYISFFWFVVHIIGGTVFSMGFQKFLDSFREDKICKNTDVPLCFYYRTTLDSMCVAMTFWFIQMLVSMTRIYYISEYYFVHQMDLELEDWDKDLSTCTRDFYHWIMQKLQLRNSGLTNAQEKNTN